MAHLIIVVLVAYTAATAMTKQELKQHLGEVILRSTIRRQEV
jgi:hypothetical protein